MYVSISVSTLVSCLPPFTCSWPTRARLSLSLSHWNHTTFRFLWRHRRGGNGCEWIKLGGDSEPIPAQKKNGDQKEKVQKESRKKAKRECKSRMGRHRDNPSPPLVRADVCKLFRTVDGVVWCSVLCGYPYGVQFGVLRTAGGPRSCCLAHLSHPLFPSP